MENLSTPAPSRGSASVAAAILVPALIIGGTASAFAAEALHQTSNTPRAGAASSGVRRGRAAGVDAAVRQLQPESRRQRGGEPEQSGKSLYRPDWLQRHHSGAYG